MKLEGIYAPIPTPFRDEEIEYSLLKENLKKWGNSSISGLVAPPIPVIIYNMPRNTGANILQLPPYDLLHNPFNIAFDLAEDRLKLKWNMSYAINGDWTKL